MLSRLFKSRARCVTALGFAGIALYPWASTRLAQHDRAQRLEQLSAQLTSATHAHSLEPELSLRVQRLSPLLASWETIGGCGAGSTAGAGSVKWIGRNTTGGLFQNITQANYIPYVDGYNLTFTSQITRDIDDRWTVGVQVPFVHKRYNNYLSLPVDVSNTGWGDVNLLGTYRLGAIRDTSLTAGLGLPTGTHAAEYKMDLLTQEKQLGPGKVTGSLTLDHTIDETWGLIVLGGLASWRGGENSLGNYRAPFASGYAYAGYFLGPFVPSLGVAVSGFLKPDRDRGIPQEVPLVLASANASIEWSNDWLALLLGVSLPFGLYADDSTKVDGEKIAQSPTGIQPWTVALAASVAPF
jgi:hypothetical protein